jgi:hypothetical protein
MAINPWRISVGSFASFCLLLTASFLCFVDSASSSSSSSLSNLKNTTSLTIAFAGNEGFAYKLIAVVEKLRSMRRGRLYHIVAYDLGFNQQEKELLRCTMPTLLSELRPFEFSKYPAHVKRLGCYAWKAILLRDLWREIIVERSRGSGASSAPMGLVWLDTAVGFAGPSPASAQFDFLERALDTAARHGGVLSDRTQGELGKWTHTAMFRYFDKSYGWSQKRFEAANVVNCNGAFSAWALPDAREGRKNDASLIMDE